MYCNVISFYKFKEVRPVVTNMFDFFQAKKLNVKENTLLETNQELFNKFSTDDFEEKLIARQEVRIIDKPLESIKSRINEKVSVISLLSAASEKLTPVIGSENTSISSRLLREIPFHSFPSNKSKFFFLSGSEEVKTNE